MTTAIKIPSIQRMILAAVLLISSGAWAGGFTIIEMGSKKTGMMTSVANPDDLSAVYHNAAGLADQHGTRIHLSSGLSIVDALSELASAITRSVSTMLLGFSVF